MSRRRIPDDVTHLAGTDQLIKTLLEMGVIERVAPNTCRITAYGLELGERLNRGDPDAIRIMDEAQLKADRAASLDAFPNCNPQ